VALETREVRVWLAAPFYSSQCQYEPLNRRSTTVKGWAIWGDMGFSVYGFSFPFSFYCIVVK
jgi:hypothetical protein